VRIEGLNRGDAAGIGRRAAVAVRVEAVALGVAVGREACASADVGLLALEAVEGIVVAGRN